MLVTEASDVFMLGCTFIEVLTGCTREPYDWLMEEDPSGVALTVYRGQEATRTINPIMVRNVGRIHVAPFLLDQNNNNDYHYSVLCFWENGTFRLLPLSASPTYGPWMRREMALEVCCLLGC